MKQQFKKAVIETTELRALFILGLVLCLRAWHAIPSLRPTQLIIPATIAQVILLTASVLFSKNFIAINAIGNFIIVGIFLFPILRQPPKPTAHWLKLEK